MTQKLHSSAWTTLPATAGVAPVPHVGKERVDIMEVMERDVMIEVHALPVWECTPISISGCCAAREACRGSHYGPQW